MTDGTDSQLQDLEPLDPGDPQGTVAAPAPASVQDLQLQALRAGMAPPAFNPLCRDKASYKFLMCGVLMVIGCCMPFSADLNQSGYKTMSGAFFLFIGLGMVWTWWGAIHNNRSTGASLKWLLLCFLPLAAQAINLINYDPTSTATAWAWAVPGGVTLGSIETPYTWSTLGGDMLTALGKSADAADAAMRVEMFFRFFGAGKMFVLLGALLAELYFIGGIVGGAKQNKQQKQARMAQASERKRR